MAIKHARKSRGIPFTLAVLILCPVISAVLFLLPFKVLLPSFVVISILYIICVKMSCTAFFRALRPAVFYFAVLYFTSVITQVFNLLRNAAPLSCGHFSPVPYPLDMALSIASAALVCEAAYTVTTDLERRTALMYAVPAVAEDLSLLSSFIPLIRRVWNNLDEARRNRGVALVRPSMLVALISISMQKAVGTQEAMLARE